MMSKGSPACCSRRQLLQTAACGFGGLALRALAQESQPRPASMAPGGSPRHLPARAQRVIFLFMQGGPSHVDSFDHKPELTARDGQILPFDDARILANTGMRQSAQRLMKPLWEFAPQGECGKVVSSLFPQVGALVDDLTFLHGMHTEGVAHGPATLFLHCGAASFVRPSIGSWIYYGLGTENQNLPGFVSLAPSLGNGGPRNYGAAFLPARFQGTPVGQAGSPELELRNLSHPSRTPAEQRRQLDLLQELNRAQAERVPGDTEAQALIESFELAWRMQQHAPDVLDLSQETAETHALYGIGEKETDAFGRQCLAARRLCEAGVRYVQATYGDNSANPAWDQHSNLPKHAEHARACDRPIAGLLIDLKRRGLLDDTLVWWGAEFGRTPYAEKNGTGRDHNPGGFTMWLAGAGLRPGFSFGATDEFGFRAVEGKVHMHDLHATILHLLGLDHERLTFHYAGRPFRLTDVHGRVVTEILA